MMSAREAREQRFLKGIMDQMARDEKEEREAKLEINPEMGAAISNVLERFNFEVVHQYMEQTGRTWANFETNRMEVPSVAELKATAKGLLEEAATSKHVGHGACATGGFEARADSWDGGATILQLSFKLESCSTSFR